MRLCAVLGCDAAADVWWHGAWCSHHADHQFGRVPMWVGQMESRTGPSVSVRREGARGFPSPQVGAIAQAGHPRPSSVAPSEPLISIAELEDLLAQDYVGGPGFVEAL